MQIKNSENKFGIVAKTFHWIMAFLIIGMLFVGLYMTSLPVGFKKLTFYGWHKECGMLVLFLVILRSMWRLSNSVPRLTLPWWEKYAARAVHYAFYGFMFAMPITGWLMSSAAGLPVSFFGWFVIPTLISPNHELMETLEKIHAFLAYGLIATIVLHTLAALKHHFLDKDTILTRML